MKINLLFMPLIMLPLSLTAYIEKSGTIIPPLSSSTFAFTESIKLIDAHIKKIRSKDFIALCSMSQFNFADKVSPRLCIAKNICKENGKLAKSLKSTLNLVQPQLFNDYLNTVKKFKDNTQYVIESLDSETEKNLVWELDVDRFIFHQEMEGLVSRLTKLKEQEVA